MSAKMQVSYTVEQEEKNGRCTDRAQVRRYLGATGRGHEADADTVRIGEPKSLAKALEKACKVLTKRLEGLPSDDPMHLWIEDAITTAKARAEVLKTEELQDSKEAMKTGKFLNHAFPLWEAYASITPSHPHVLEVQRTLKNS